MISQTLEYSLRAVVCLAAEGKPQTAQEIARMTRVPAAYLAKVLQQLAKSGLVHGQRGPNGGFALDRPADRISMWDVLEAMEPLQRIRACPLDLMTHRGRLCPLHRKLDDAIAYLERTFRDTSLADLLAESDAPRPLCDVPSGPAPKGRVAVH